MKIHCLQTLNICTKVHGNRYKKVWTKVVDQQTHTAIHRMSPLAWLKANFPVSCGLWCTLSQSFSHLKTE